MWKEVVRRCRIVELKRFFKERMIRESVLKQSKDEMKW